MRLITRTRNELPVTRNNNNNEDTQTSPNKLEPSASTCKHSTCVSSSTSFIDVIQYVSFWLYLFKDECVCMRERERKEWLFSSFGSLHSVIVVLQFSLYILWWTKWSMRLSLLVKIHWSACCDELIKFMWAFHWHWPHIQTRPHNHVVLL